MEIAGLATNSDTARAHVVAIQEKLDAANDAHVVARGYERGHPRSMHLDGAGAETTAEVVELHVWVISQKRHWHARIGQAL